MKKEAFKHDLKDTSHWTIWDHHSDFQESCMISTEDLYNSSRSHRPSLFTNGEQFKNSQSILARC
jgi:hypothetical protein